MDSLKVHQQFIDSQPADPTRRRQSFSPGREGFLVFTYLFTFPTCLGGKVTCATTNATKPTFLCHSNDEHHDVGDDKHSVFDRNRCTTYLVEILHMRGAASGGDEILVFRCKLLMDQFPTKMYQELRFLLLLSNKTLFRDCFQCRGHPQKRHMTTSSTCTIDFICCHQNYT